MPSSRRFGGHERRCAPRTRQHAAADRDLAGVGPLQPGDAAQRRRLAAAARAEQREELAFAATSKVTSSHGLHRLASVARLRTSYVEPARTREHVVTLPRSPTRQRQPPTPSAEQREHAEERDDHQHAQRGELGELSVLLQLPDATASTSVPGDVEQDRARQLADRHDRRRSSRPPGPVPTAAARCGRKVWPTGRAAHRRRLLELRGLQHRGRA